MLSETPAEELNRLSEQVIGAAIDVHRELGPGLLESAYQACLTYELVNQDLRVEVHRPVPLVYKGVHLDCGFRMDLLIEERLIVELKCVQKIEPVHVAQVLSYLKLTGLKLALLINFHVPHLRSGIKRLVNHL